jgi:D-glycero-D-manno-heptose 1,7-bisphosphate phosphatase
MGRSAAVTLAKAVFFDRDGVLLKSFQDAETTRGPRMFSEIAILPDAVKSLARIHDSRFIPLCITNQPDISRGLTTLREQEDINWWLKRNTGIYDAILCPHDDSDYCVCRKPQPGMVYWFAVLLQIDLSRSWMVGDRVSDRLAAVRAGIPQSQTIQIETNQGLGDAVRWILANSK